MKMITNQQSPLPFLKYPVCNPVLSAETQSPPEEDKEGWSKWVNRIWNYREMIDANADKPSNTEEEVEAIVVELPEVEHSQRNTSYNSNSSFPVNLTNVLAVSSENLKWSSPKKQHMQKDEARSDLPYLDNEVSSFSHQVLRSYTPGGLTVLFFGGSRQEDNATQHVTVGVKKEQW